MRRPGQPGGQQLGHQRHRESRCDQPARRQHVARDERDPRLEARRHARAVDQVVARRRRPRLSGQVARSQPLAARPAGGPAASTASIASLPSSWRSVPSGRRGGARRPGSTSPRAARPPPPSRRAPRPTPRPPRPAPPGALAQAYDRLRDDGRQRARERADAQRLALGRGQLGDLRVGLREPVGDRVGVGEQQRARLGRCRRRRGRARAAAAPSWRSSAATCWETAGWVSASASPARENDP